MTKWGMAILVLTLISIPLIIPQSAHACSCVNISPTKAYDWAVMVFSGRVVSLKGPTGAIISSADPVTVEFQVNKVWKGTQQRSIILSTALSSASCGYEFQVGQWYLVYANGSEDDFQVGLCGGTKRLFQADEDLNFLGDGNEITEDHDIDITLAGDKEVISSDKDDGFNYIALITLFTGIIIGVASGVVLTKRRHSLKS